MLKKDKCICIRTTDYSETSQILTFFTADTGKLSLIAKGAKRPKSSFGGPVQLLTAGEMVFFLQKLDEDADNKVLASLIFFEFTILKETGSQPVFDRCINCKRNFDTSWKQCCFSASANGFLCRDCEAAFVDKRTITTETAEYLSQPQNIPQANRSVLVLIQNLLIEYITHILERPPRTAVTILKLINTPA